MKMDGKSIWIYFKFVKLPDFCYGCRRMGHVLRECKEVDLDTHDEVLQYGPWLRGSPLKSRRRNVEARIQDEHRLFEAFRKNKKACSTR